MLLQQIGKKPLKIIPPGVLPHPSDGKTRKIRGWIEEFIMQQALNWLVPSFLPEKRQIFFEPVGKRCAKKTSNYTSIDPR